MLVVDGNEYPSDAPEDGAFQGFPDEKRWAARWFENRLTVVM